MPCDKNIFASGSISNTLDRDVSSDHDHARDDAVMHDWSFPEDGNVIFRDPDDDTFQDNGRKHLWYAYVLEDDVDCLVVDDRDEKLKQR